jgi:hypothetical protein
MVKRIQIDTVKVLDEHLLYQKEFGGQIKELEKNIEMFRALQMHIMATDLFHVTNYDQGRIQLL